MLENGESLASCTLGVVEEGLTIAHEELQVADLGMIERRKVDLADNAVRNREPYPLAVEYAVSIRSFALCSRSARRDGAHCRRLSSRLSNKRAPARARWARHAGEVLRETQV